MGFSLEGTARDVVLESGRSPTLWPAVPGASCTVTQMLLTPAR